MCGFKELIEKNDDWTFGKIYILVGYLLMEGIVVNSFRYYKYFLLCFKKGSYLLEMRVKMDEMI